MPVGATYPAAAARDLGYILTVPDCARLFATKWSVISAMLSAPAGDPMHLPSVVVSGYPGPAPRRVRMADLEHLAARLSLPPVGDLIRAGDAVAILADGALKPNTPIYLRHVTRLYRAARSNRITAYTLPGQRERRYSRTEVQALKAAFDAEGITKRRTTRSRTFAAVVKRGEALGLIDTAAVMEITGVCRSTVASWDRQGLYRAHRIDWCWFFDPARIETRPPRAKRQPTVEVQCACCGRLVTRKASEVRKKRELAAAHGHEPQFFCAECCTSGEALGLRHVSKRRKTGPSPRISAAVKEQWENGARDRAAAADRMRTTVKKKCKSPKGRAEWQDARVKSRWGRGLTDEEKAEHERRARSYACMTSQRSLTARELEQGVRELSLSGKTIKQMAAELGTTESNVKQIRRRQGLPLRQRGRPPKK